MKNLTIVLKVSVALALLFVMVGVIIPEQMEAGLELTQSFMFETFGWYFQILVSLLLFFAIYLALGKYGNIKLGTPDSKPEFSRPVWFAMLFSAGIGIGLFFYGVSEPVAHFSVPPSGPGGVAESAVGGVTYTWLHWGFHAWAIYALVALALALQQFRYKSPGLISTTLSPVFGDRMRGPLGHVVDVIAVFATVFGVAASLGLGSQQINSGLVYLFDVPYSFTVQLIIMVVITIIFVTSATTGIQRGIKYLSSINISISAIFLIFIFITGPTLFLLNTFTSSLAHYVETFIPMGLRMSPVDPDEAGWTQGWTVFYWAWWISWTPFVGMFIARVSKGRTIREFIAGVILAPSLVTFLWFAILGGTGIHLELYEGLLVSGESLETALFFVLQELPFTALVSALTVIIITIFFVTTADSATFVLGMQTTGGKLNPPVQIKVLWGFIFVAITAVLLLSGGLQAFQTAIVVSAFPLSFIIIFMCFGIVKTLQDEN
ncbi:glycine/betaine ABC transporter permease [Salipaludibacillus keqinensis]|uniref:Glycine/betaine ABC transporter permease n=1 Tax=Salipaludibacillus keqinensis TaxID=2045207 RepID=A0A323TKM7_9BACI|nr:BCCT family transporter [Salipaludibacillus keqinensis]PYZ94656.1 glycine/betaine ABC transporter permease [Salipaludibacillus keqinensis]